MKKSLFIVTFLMAGYGLSAQQTGKPISVPDSTQKIMLVETACGQCQFGLKAPGCSLAIKRKGQAYFVDGTTIDEHGDAHAEDGFCNAVRKAEVQGTFVKGRFKATYFRLLRKEEKPATH